MPSEYNYSDIVGRKPYRPFTSYVPADRLSSYSVIGGSLPGQSLRTGKTFDPLSEGIDTQWAGKTSDGQKFNNYYDYYFSGEDVKIYIDGLFDPEYELDIAVFGFKISQEKQPLYGFWSYNYDAVMYGTRIVGGTFSLYSRYPGRMRDLLSTAAEQRVLFAGDKPGSSKIQSYLRGDGTDPETIEDEKNIQRYWNRSNLDRLSSDGDGSDNRNIFSAHPPFNFIIKYGTQEGSLSTVMRNKGTDVDDNFDVLDRLMASDYNERLVKPGRSNVEMDIVLQDVNLLDMTTTYAPGGSAVIETYQFIARDMYISNGNLRNTDKSIMSTVDAAGASSTRANAVAPPITPEQLRQLSELLMISEPEENPASSGGEGGASSGGTSGGFSGGGGGDFSGGGASGSSE